MEKDLEIMYFKNFADLEDFEILKSIDWVSRENTPRQEYWDTTLGEPYTYGSGRGVRTYEPNPRLEITDKYRSKLHNFLGVFFEGCFLNKYPTSRDHLGWHADDDDGIDHTKPIAVITFGHEREINWKRIGSKGEDSINRKILENGSLFVMSAGMQSEYLHRIPRCGFETDTRISMTFRSLLRKDV